MLEAFPFSAKAASLCLLLSPPQADLASPQDGLSLSAFFCCAYWTVAWLQARRGPISCPTVPWAHFILTTPEPPFSKGILWGFL